MRKVLILTIKVPHLVKKYPDIWGNPKCSLSCSKQPATCNCLELINTGRFIMFSMITNIYNKKTKGPTLMELFTDTGKLKKGVFI